MELGIMIEAQEGLNWGRWRRIVADAERLGYTALRTSDHCMSLSGVDRESLQSWIALALAAEWTSRIQLAPMMSPLTFYVPAVLARMARAVDERSGGRLVLGVGAGWNQAEHEAFGIPFPSWKERFDNLERGMERIRLTLADHPIPLLVGGRSPRSLTIAARWADEWNEHNVPPESVAQTASVLDQRCRQLGRDPGTLRRSVMLGYLVGRDRSEIADRYQRLVRIQPWLGGLPAGAGLTRLHERGWLVGTPSDIAEQLRAYAETGASLVLLQHFLLDDSEALELMARHVMPRLA